jgi:signal peptidase I
MPATPLLAPPRKDRHGMPGQTVVPDRPRRPERAAAVTTTGRWAFRAGILIALVASVFITVVPWTMQRGEVHLAYITSGSMLPGLPIGGTIAYTRPSQPDTLSPGDIITFRALGNGTVVTHRIVSVHDTEALGGVHYQTKGDNNPTPDPDLVPAGNVIGLVSGPVPWWQQLAVSGQTPRGRLLVFGSLFLLIALAEGRDLVRGARRAPTKAAV